MLVSLAILIIALYSLYLAGYKVAFVLVFLIFILFISLFPDFYKRLKMFLNNTPALILTNDELIDNINSQKFKWGDIKNISTSSLKINHGISYMAISLVNPEKYITVIRNPCKRLIAILNEKYFNGAFSIQPNIIKCNKIELFDNLSNYRNNYDLEHIG